jgi:hypothetical protein
MENLALLRGDPEQWSTEWRYRFQEREAILLESNVPDARQKAIADIQRCAETELFQLSQKKGEMF